MSSIPIPSSESSALTGVSGIPSNYSATASTPDLFSIARKTARTLVNTGRKFEQEAIETEKLRLDQLGKQHKPIISAYKGDFIASVDDFFSNPENKSDNMYEVLLEKADNYIASIDASVDSPSGPFTDLVDPAGESGHNSITKLREHNKYASVNRLKAEITAYVNNADVIHWFKREEAQFAKDKSLTSAKGHFASTLDRVTENPYSISDIDSVLEGYDFLPEKEASTHKLKIIDELSTSSLRGFSDEAAEVIGTVSANGLTSLESDVLFDLIESQRNSFTSALAPHIGEDAANDAYYKSIAPALSDFIKEAAPVPMEGSKVTVGQHFMSKRHHPALRAILHSKSGFWTSVQKSINSAMSKNSKQFLSDTRARIDTVLDSIDNTKAILGSNYLSEDTLEQAKNDFSGKDGLENEFKELSSIIIKSGDITEDDKENIRGFHQDKAIIESLHAVASGKLPMLMVSRYFGDSQYTSNLVVQDGTRSFDKVDRATKWYEDAILDSSGQVRDEVVDQLFAQVSSNAEYMRNPTDLRAAIMKDGSKFKNAMISLFNDRQNQWINSGGMPLANELIAMGGDHKNHGILLKSALTIHKMHDNPETKRKLFSVLGVIDQEYPGYNLTSLHDTMTDNEIREAVAMEDTDAIVGLHSRAKADGGFSNDIFLKSLNKLAKNDDSLHIGLPFARAIPLNEAASFLRSDAVLSEDINIDKNWEKVTTHGFGDSNFIMEYEAAMGISQSLLNSPNSKPHGRLRGHELIKRWAAHKVASGTSVGDVKGMIKDRLKSFAFFDYNQLKRAISFSETEAHSEDQFAPTNHMLNFFLPGQPGNLAQSVATISEFPHYAQMVIADKLGYHLVDLIDKDPSKVYVGNKPLKQINLSPSIPERLRKGIFTRENDLLADSFWYKYGFIIDEDSSTVTLGWETSTGFEGGYSDLQPIYIEEDGIKSAVQWELNEFFRSILADDGEMKIPSTGTRWEKLKRFGPQAIFK